MLGLACLVVWHTVHWRLQRNHPYIDNSVLVPLKDHPNDIEARFRLSANAWTRLFNRRNKAKPLSSSTL